MKASAFCPGHVSCIFQPMPYDDTLMAGSRGVGIRLSLGTRVTVSERGDAVTRVVMDGQEARAPITELVARVLAPDTGFDITVVNDLPMGQGFGTSASGAIATALCMAELTDRSARVAIEAAHCSEVELKGGLGDISAIISNCPVPVRTRAGLPPRGTVEDAGFEIEDLTLAVLGGKLETGSVLGDRREMGRIRRAGKAATDRFIEDPTKENLFRQSSLFSAEIGLESDEIRRVSGGLRAMGYGASMCMLGNSVFTDAPADAVRELAPEAAVFACSSSSEDLSVTRTE